VVDGIKARTSASLLGITRGRSQVPFAISSIHSDIKSKIVYWYTPQLDRQLAMALGKSEAKVAEAGLRMCPPEKCR
jgi:hypothetical protein